MVIGFVAPLSSPDPVTISVSLTRALKPADRTRGLLGNTAVLALVQVSGIVVSLLLTPYILHKLGLERFGLWAFLSSLVAFAGVLQLGLGRGSIRFIAFYSERNEFAVVRRILSYGVLWHVALGVIMTPLAWLVGDAVLPQLHISRDLLGTATTLFPLVFAYAFFSGAVRPLASLLIGLERMWMVSVTTLVSQLVYAALVVVLLSQRTGLYGLLAAAASQTLFQAGAYYVMCRRLVGRVFGNPFALDRAVLKDLLRFGGWIQVATLAGLANEKADAVVIGAWVNIGSVGTYSIGTRIAQLTRMIPLTLLPPLFPTAAGIHAQGDEKRLARTILQGSRLVGLLSVAFGGFIFVTASLITTAWLGRTYPNVEWIAIVMVIAYVVNNLTGVGTTVVSAIGKPRYETEYGVLGMLLNITATLTLAPFFGLRGIVGGTVLAMVICSVYFLWRFHRLMRLSLWEYLGHWLWRLLAAATLAGLAVYALRTATPVSVERGRGQAAVALGLLGVVYGLALLLALRALRFFDARDLALIQRVLPSRLQRWARLPAVEFLFGVRPWT
jgi:O-antigen/teichoic acid export membrane protein